MFSAESQPGRPSEDGVRADLELVARMRAGEQRAFDEFFDTYAPRLTGFAARRCSLDPSGLEDLIQVTLISAIRGLGTFRGGSSLFTWLCQICRNRLADIARTAKRRPKAHSLEKMVEDANRAEILNLAAESDPLADCIADSSASAVRKVINGLPTTYAQILELRFGADLPVPMIARELGISESAAESRLSRARQAFRERWERSPALLAPSGG